ncbi:MAG TPA: hypothetical protein VIJ66_06905 [Solirubrobacteraceae bacterium]
MATKERLHELIDSLPDTPETELRLDAIAEEIEPNGTVEDSTTISPERQAGLDKLAGYFEHPETAPWDWDVLRNAKYDAWRV